MDDQRRSVEREIMVKSQIEARGVNDARVLAAMRSIPRHCFVPPALRFLAYSDFALPIACGQTISQPYIVGLMTSLLNLHGDENVLEIGTGSGYQAAVLACLVRRVITLEFIPELAAAARQALASLSIENVEVICADGSLGYPPAAPYDGILITAAAPSVPETLFSQLTSSGRLVLPVGRPGSQDLQVWTFMDEVWQYESVLPVEFVPLRGAAGWHSSDWPDKALKDT